MLMEEPGGIRIPKEQVMCTLGALDKWNASEIRTT